MKKTFFFLTLLLVLAHAALAQTSTPFITQWQGGTAIGYNVEGAVDYTLYNASTNAVVGTTTTINNGTISITNLNASTTYNLHIRFNKVATNRRFSSNNATQLTNLRAVLDWGDTEWTSMLYAFRYATNLTTIPTAAPNLNSVTNFSFMFTNARVFNQDLSSWDVSKGINFAYMFSNITAFNSDLSSWDVSKGTDFSNMFNNASAFNQDLGKWRFGTTTAIDMRGIFFRSKMSCDNIDATLTGWDTNRVAGTNRVILNLSDLRYTTVGSGALANLINKNWTITPGTVIASCPVPSTPFITQWRGGTAIGYYVQGAVDYTLYDASTNAVVRTTTTISNGTISIANLNASTTYNLHIRFNKVATSRRFSSNNATQLTNLRAVLDWGDTEWTSMLQAFQYATNLTTIPTAAPDLNSVTNFSNMFQNATAFNQDLSSWELSNVAPTGLSNFLAGAGIDCANLSTSLISWANNPNTASGVILDLTGSYYSTSAVAAIATLSAAPYNWVITTGTVVPDADCIPAALPISLLSFGATKNGSTAVVLDWEIIEDEEVKMYVIERSTPHSEWQELTTLAPTTDKAPTKLYSYTDAQPANGVNLYRLKITDVFGKTTYSKVANVVFASESEVSIYPNPATTQITIASPSVAISTINVINAQGQKVYSVALDSVHEHQVDLSPLASGVYFLHLTNADGKAFHEKVIKK